MSTVSYSSKATALRGGKRAGMENPVAYQGEDGRWNVSDASEVLVIDSLSKARDFFEASEDELLAQRGRLSADIARDEAWEAELPVVTKVKGAKGLEPGTYAAKLTEVDVDAKGVVRVDFEVVKPLPYKRLPRNPKSSVDKPLNVVHSFLDENPTLTRKQAVSRLVEMGINFYTARTQYQRWFQKRKGDK